VGPLRLDQSPREHHRAEDERHGGDHHLPLLPSDGRIEAEGAGRQQRQDVEDSEDDATQLEAGPEGDGGEREPHQRRAFGAPGDHHRIGEQQGDDRPGGGDPDRWVAAPAHEAIRHREAGNGHAERHDPPPTHFRGGGDQRHGEDGEAGRAVAAQPRLHVEQPLAPGFVANRGERFGL
jgi:hypothetical protein